MKNHILFTTTCILLIHGAILCANDNFKNIDRFLKLAFKHAKNYPPRFDSKIQRKLLETQLVKTLAQLEGMIKNSKSDSEVLFRLGKASTFAYNLDMKGSKEKADKYFKSLFILDPNHAKGHLYCGQHLSGRGEFQRGIKHLKIAADAGWDVALTMIGLAYMNIKKNDKAKVYFQKFQKKHPNDRQVKMLLKALKPSSKYKYELLSTQKEFH